MTRHNDTSPASPFRTGYPRPMKGVLLLPLLLGLAGCAAPGLIAGGAATVGVAAAQERSIGDAVDDVGIQLQIEAFLLDRSTELFRKVNATVHEGRVLLTGAVPTAEDRVEAVRIVWTVKGVTEVLNELQISDRSSVVDYFKDAKITTQLRFQMLRDRDISDINFSIETVNGTVYIMGIARTRAELDKITDHARNIAGVVKVVSHVRLSDDPARTSG
jgi:osmotically-inducible protein OsmY